LSSEKIIARIYRNGHNTTINVSKRALIACTDHLIKMLLEGEIEAFSISRERR